MNPAALAAGYDGNSAGMVLSEPGWPGKPWLHARLWHLVAPPLAAPPLATIMAMDISTLPTMSEQILVMREDDLAAFAKGRALSWADSSRMEGLVIDQDLLETQILADYRKLREETNAQE